MVILWQGLPKDPTLQDAGSKAHESRFNPRLCLGDDEGCISEHAYDCLRRDSLDSFEGPYDPRRNNGVSSYRAPHRFCIINFRCDCGGEELASYRRRQPAQP
ncbi:hypothetical protein N7486_003887 [Penicillium sp. IBT 16267x]|nr:hypothetical protein N7486_003887 [Penicillium sp. IBT 16267x]